MRPKKQKTPVKLLPAPSIAHSGLKLGLLSIWLRLNRLATPANSLAAGALIYLALSATFTASFFVPRSVDFSFAKQNCFTSPTLLPNMIAKNQGDIFEATPNSSLSIAGYPLYSHTTCVEPSQAPEAKVTDNISFSPLGIGFLKKHINVSAGTLPKVEYKDALNKPIATRDALTFRLDTQDRVFNYQLSVDGQVTDCTKTEDQTISCNLSKLNLKHSTTYNFALQRIYDGRVQSDVFNAKGITVGAVLVSESSIAAGQVVFNIPTEIKLTLNKPANSFSMAELNLITGDTRQKIPATFDLEDQTLNVIFAEPLPRGSSFELKIQNIAATDGGHLPEPFVLPFTTSGGPKVKSANIGSYKVSASTNVVLNFDTAVSASQALTDFIKLEINGSVVAASISRSGSTVTINPNSDLPKCSRFSVRVLNGLQSEFGVSGGSAWTYNSRVICQTVFGIGTSVQGRGITAYRFGSGDSKIVFVGTTHGDEKSSTSTLNSFVDYLERNYDQIPGHRTVVVIPNLNPDAYAMSRRTNANNVDLNRNFPANNWKQGVTMPGGSFNPNGGGSAPLSEPESSALAAYVLGLNPRLVLTYHAAAGVVIPNDSGDSNDLAKTYDQKSNLNYASNSQTGTLFQYDTTGAFEDWLHDKHGIPTLLVELWTKSSNELSRNQNAMWHMVALP